MNVLSLFDGKSSGYTALELNNIKVNNYYSAEIDKYAIQVSNAIHPNQIRLGDVTNWREWDIDFASINLLLGGFPCQAWSMAGKQQGDKDERGMLFWVMLDIFKHVQKLNPDVKFLIENVKMKKEFEQYITYHTEQALGKVNKHLINSALVSAQNRNRYYWTNINGVEQPEDRGVLLKNVIDGNCFEQVNSDGWHKWWDKNKDFQCKKLYSQVCNDKEKAITMTARQYASCNGNFIKVDAMRGHHIVDDRLQYRKLTPRECFRLQTVPEHYIDKILACGVSNTQLYKIAGNGWTDEVIAHIFKRLKHQDN